MAGRVAGVVSSPATLSPRSVFVHIQGFPDDSQSCIIRLGLRWCAPLGKSSSRRAPLGEFSSIPRGGELR